MEPRTLYLINDDDPSQFAPRAAQVLGAPIELDGRELLPVTIHPAIEGMGEPIETALLLPRSRQHSVRTIQDGPLSEPMRVFVYRAAHDVPIGGSELTAADLSVAFWGLVGDSIEAVRKT
jgi:hypothetical protein